MYNFYMERLESLYSSKSMCGEREECRLSITIVPVSALQIYQASSLVEYSPNNLKINPQKIGNF